MNFTTKHWAVVGAMLIAIGTQLSGLQSFHDALTPAFIGGFLLMVGTNVATLFLGAPVKPYEPGVSKDRRDLQ